MATIRDVSKLAEVSVATVSRVINENGYVNELTRKRVLDAIEQLNYRPNHVARSLFKGKSQMIALFVPDIQNPFFPELARAVEDTATQHDYTFILCNTDNDPLKEVTYLEAILQKSIDGIVMVSSTMSSSQLKEIHIPVIALDRKINANIPSVTVNNYEGAKEAVQFLKDAGCEKIAHIAGVEQTTSAQERLLGYLDEMKNDRYYPEGLIYYGNYTYTGSYEATIKLLTENQQVDGIFASNDVMGIGALKAAESLGIRIPQDLNLISFDGIQISQATSPALTTMEQPIYNMGKRATEMLFEKINHPEKEIHSEQFKVTLVQRQSTERRAIWQ